MFLAGKTMRNELLMFWRLCLEANANVGNGNSCDFDEIRDEFETLSMMTDWSLLKLSCAAEIARLDRLPLVATG